MKTIKQLREEYDIVSLNQVHDVSDELMLEGRENSIIKASDKAIPSPTVMPAMLLFRRVAYRQYPNKQTVALYYSKMVNKYLSVPFGPDGNLNLSEAVVLDNIDEGAGLEALKGGIKGAAKGAFKGHVLGAAVGAGPGAVVGTLAGGALGAIKGAKKGYEKAKEMDKNLEESEVWTRKEGQSEAGGLNRKGIAAYRRSHPGSKLSMAVTTKPSKLKKGSKAANRRKSFCARMGGMKKRLTSAKTAHDPDSRINKALRKWNCEEDFKLKLSQLREERLNENPALAALGAAGRAALGAAGSAIMSGAKSVVKSVLGPAEKTDSAWEKHKGQLVRPKPQAKATSSWKSAKPADATFDSKYRESIRKGFDKPATAVAENKISDVQNMLNEGIETMDLSINGRTVTLNNSMAKKIIRVYESVNTKNKKIVESMLNEDLDSFKKLLNFSIKA